LSNSDFDALLDFLVGFARRVLPSQGSFAPFGATMTTAQKIQPSAAYDGEQSTAQELIALLVEGMRTEADAGKIIACGICLDVRAKPPDRTSLTDTIQVHLEHRNGECADVFCPYEINDAGAITYGTLFTSKATPQVFRS
jgi:hypothetical protein